MTTIIFGILEEGLVYAIMALGVYITYKILDFPDLSVDGTFPLGAAVTAAGRSMYMTRHVRCMNILRMSRNQYTDVNIITSRNMQEYMRSRWRTDVAG